MPPCGRKLLFLRWHGKNSWQELAGIVRAFCDDNPGFYWILHVVRVLSVQKEDKHPLSLIN